MPLKVYLPLWYMFDGYKIVSLTHKTASLGLIGSFVLSDDDKYERLNALKTKFGVDELLYLSTCNRIMLLYYSKEKCSEDFLKELCCFIQPNALAQWNTIRPSITLYQNKAAVEHVFGLACSIDSLVIGEREIFRQLRTAYDECQKHGLIFDNIRLLINATVETAKLAFSKTGIGEKPVSLVSLAHQKLKQLNPPQNSRVLVIGSGQTNTLFGKFLLQYGFHDFTVANRSIEGAIRLAKQLKGTPIALENLSKYNKGFDVMVICTGATDSIIDTKLYKHLILDEHNKKVIVDLSVPNNVSSEVISSFPVEYIEVADLRKIAQDNMEHRQNEITAVIRIIEAQLVKFSVNFQHRIIERSLSQIPTQVKKVRKRIEQEIFVDEIEKLNPETKVLINRMLDYMEKGCINEPIKAAKMQIAAS